MQRQLKNNHSLPDSERDFDGKNKKQQFAGDEVLLINEFSDDETYGYSPRNPIMVGSGDYAPLFEHYYLNALCGPNGEELLYHRIGSGYSFKTNKNNNLVGMLEKYAVYYPGLKEMLFLYINIYDSDTLKVPIGLGLRPIVTT